MELAVQQASTAAPALFANMSIKSGGRSDSAFTRLKELAIFTKSQALTLLQLPSFCPSHRNFTPSRVCKGTSLSPAPAAKRQQPAGLSRINGQAGFTNANGRMHVHYFRVCYLLQVQGGEGHADWAGRMSVVESKSPSTETCPYKQLFLAALQDNLPPPSTLPQPAQLTHV